MKGVDLRLFQFDWDLTFAVVFLNADGTPYGRYGTNAVRGNQMTHVSLAGLGKAMERALALHKGYPGNKQELAGKPGPEPSHPVPEEMPYLHEFKNIQAGSTWQSCVECHKVGEAILHWKRDKGKLTEADIWPQPLPDIVGLRMDKEDDVRVKLVPPGSPAAKAGIQPGDVLHKVNGQGLVSQTDLQWVLHHTPAKAQLTVALERQGQPLTITISLEGNWRKSNVTWRSSLTGLRPVFLHLEELPPAQKQKLGIAVDKMGLKVRYAVKKAAQAGMRNGDVVTAVDGQMAPMSEGDFLAYLWLREQPTDHVLLTVLRKGEKLNIKVPVK